jgi:magnesium transporter
VIVDAATYVDGVRVHHVRSAGVGSAGVGSAGVGSAGVGSAGVGSAGVGSAGVGSADRFPTVSGLPANAFAWVGLRVPEEAQLVAAATACGIDLDCHETLQIHDRPVLSIEHDHLVLVLRTTIHNDRAAETAFGELTVAMGARAVLTVRHGLASPLSDVRRELESEPDLLSEGPPLVVASIVEQVVRDYGPAVDKLERMVLDVERAVFQDSRRRPTQQLYRLKREVRDVAIATESLRDPLDRLRRHFVTRLQARPAGEIAEQALEQLDRVVARMTSLSNLLDAALGADATQVSLQQNEDMRRISAWVAIAAVPTMIAGIFGMNFEHMPELGWSLGYPIALLVMGGSSFALWRAFRRSGWL